MLRSEIRFFDIKKAYFSSWVQEKRVEKYIENEFGNINRLSKTNSMKDLTLKNSQHFRYGSENGIKNCLEANDRFFNLIKVLIKQKRNYYIKNTLFNRWKNHKPVVQQNKAEEGRKYVLLARKLSLKNLRTLINPQFSYFINRIHEISFHDLYIYTMKYKLQGNLRIFRQNLLKHFIKLKPDVFEEYTEVFEEVSVVKTTKNSDGVKTEIFGRNVVDSKATFKNLRHVIQKSLIKAFNK